MSKSEETLEPGTVFGSYEVIRVMGAGAFGAVYEAIRKPLGKRVALKVLHKKLITQPEIVARFIREAETTARLHHPHIVETFDVGTYQDAPFLAMEYLDGEALNKRLTREKKLAPAFAVDVMIPVLSAMAAVHTRGIIHRDLKPDNIFLVRERAGVIQPKILDFGIAKVTSLEAEHGLTRTSALLGTPYYMSPEQARESKHIDARSDQWALAVILFECLTGKKPFTGSSLLELLTRISMNQHATLRELAPELPAELEAVVDRAMQTDIGARYIDVREFARALLPFARPETRSSWEAEFASDSDVTTELPDFSAMFPEKTTPDKSAPLSTSATATTPDAPPATVALTESPLPPAGATLVASEPEPAYSIGTLTLSARESLLPKPEPKPAPPRKRPPVLLAGALTALTLVGVGAWVSTRPGAAPAPRAPVTRPAAPAPSPRIPPPEVLRTESQPVAQPPAEPAHDAGSPVAPTPPTPSTTTSTPTTTPTVATPEAPAEPSHRSRRSRRADAGAAPTESHATTPPAEETGANGVGIR
jgi:serine/threonine-protein kinase